MTYNEYTNGSEKAMQVIRMKINRAAEKGLITKVSVKKHFNIPKEVLALLSDNAAVSSIAPDQKQDVSKRPKAAKQATIPMPVNNSIFAAEQTPVKSQMSSIFSPVLRFSASDAAMVTVCIVTAYGLISQYGLIGTGAAILYAIFALNTSRLTKKELSLESAKMAVNWLIGFELALVYVHSTMYYQKIVTNTGLMFNTGGWDTILTACLFGLGTSLLPIVLLLVSITETKEKSEHNYQNA
jgi:hypothetical protein